MQLQNDMAPPVARFGCLTALAGVIVGIALAVTQNAVLLATWSHCAMVPTAIAVDTWPGGGRYVGMPAVLIRFILYGAAFILAAALASRLRTSHKVLAYAAMVLAGLFLCLLLFAADYSLSSGMGAGSYHSTVCPGGHLPWWPL